MKLYYAILIIGLTMQTNVHAENAKRETATFAGGCFWCMQADFEGVAGVLSATSGYTGGEMTNPTYDDVSSGATGHVEAVEVQYDPGVISYDKLLDIFWRSIDPFDADGQFCDKGTQYHSVIFYHNEEQHRAALASKVQLEEKFKGRGPIATLLKAAAVFYPAENYHQNYHDKNPLRYRLYRTGCGRDSKLKQIWSRFE